MYYVSSRYYDPEVGRFISADTTDILGATSNFYDKNLYAYCDNNPVNRRDAGGYAWETIFDVLSLGASIMEVAFNPADPFAWIGLAGDAVDLIPFVTGVGETIRALKVSSKVGNVADTVDDAIDTYRNVKKVTKGTDLEVHHIVEKRFSEQLGFGRTGSGMPSIALSKTEHRNYTNDWRKYAGYGKQHDPKIILEAAIKTYSNNPNLLGAAIYTITREMK